MAAAVTALSRCRVGALRVGDQVRTTAHRWETVTALTGGDAYSRSVRVTTDATGPDHPWVWVASHTVPTRRSLPAATSTPMGEAA